MNSRRSSLNPAEKGPDVSDLLRAPAEIKYAEELDWLESVDDSPKPFSWRLSPKMVRLFILGS